MKLEMTCGRPLKAIALLWCAVQMCFLRNSWAEKSSSFAAFEKNRQVLLVNKNYNPLSSRVLIRKILFPSRANLDYAAYYRNMMLMDTISPVFHPATAKIELKQANFGKTLEPSTVRSSIDQTPLSDLEKGGPISWPGLKEYLQACDFEKAFPLIEKCDRVAEEKWGDKKLNLPPQELTLLYVHKTGENKYELWAGIDFKPWARALPFLHNGNELYGKLDLATVPANVIERIIGDYMGRGLLPNEVTVWANDLASFWYPTYNTDILQVGDGESWPGRNIEPEIKSEISGVSVLPPFIVIKGLPQGYSRYNVFITQSNDEKVGDSIQTSFGVSAPGIEDTSLIKRSINSMLGRLNAELKEGGGSYGAWADRLKGFHAELEKIRTEQLKNAKAVTGKDGFLFFGKSIDYLLGGDLRNQTEEQNPYPVIVSTANLLKKNGIHLLFIPIPVKPVIYGEKLATLSQYPAPNVDPYGRKLTKELLEAGVEVIDVLPALLEEKTKDNSQVEPVYQRQDTHWTSRGLECVAGVIADRVKKSGWYAKSAKRNYGERETTFVQTGDLVSRLPIEQQKNYPPASLIGHQVISPDSKSYEDDKNSPILVLGDSFCGVYERTGCGHAGVSAHIAKDISMPVGLLMSYGGGPTVIQLLKKLDKKELAKIKIVIWIMSSRDLYHYWGKWEPLDSL